MSKQWSIWSFLALFFPSVVVLGIHAYIGSFNRFIADDFCSIYMAERLGVFRSLWYWYLNWFGTYSASILDGFMPIMGISGLTMVVTMTLILWVTLATWAIWLLLPNHMPRDEKVMTSVSFGTAIIFVTLLLSPSITQSLYWWGGMRSYIPPLLFVTLYLIIFQLFMLQIRSTKEKIFWSIFGFLVSFIGCGFSETYTPVQIVLMAFLTSLGLVSRKMKPNHQAFSFLVTGLLGSTLALFVIILAPGNSIRQAFFPIPPGLNTILGISLKGYLVFLGELFGSLEKDSGLFGLVCAAAWLGFRSSVPPTPRGWIAPAFLLAGFILAFGCFPPSAYGMSDVPPDRTLIIAVYFLTVCFALSGYSFGAWLSLLVKAESGFWVSLGFGVSLLVLILFSAFSNGLAQSSSIQQYRDYALNWDRMNTRILLAKTAGESQVIIPIMTNWAGLDNPSDNPKFWVNVCVSKYYDIHVLTPPIER